MACINYSSHADFGSTYRASTSTGYNDLGAYNALVNIMDTQKPRLILVNFRDVDSAGHDNNWGAYISAIKNVDNLIFNLWNKIQTDAFYQNNTTLFVTNDHGRHDDGHGGIIDHGCNCEGCQHIMLLAIGRNVTAGQEINLKHTERDIAPTVGDLLEFSTPLVHGTSLFQGDVSLPVFISSFEAIAGHQFVKLLWTVQSETNNLGFIIERKDEMIGNFIEIASYQYVADLLGRNSSTTTKTYSFIDYNVVNNNTYKYRLIDVDINGIKHYADSTIFTTEITNNLLAEFELYQNYPNPFNSHTQIKFSFKDSSIKSANINFYIYCSTGQQVNSLSKYHILSDFISFDWNGKDRNNKDLSSGIYYGTLRFNNSCKSIKMLLVR